MECDLYQNDFPLSFRYCYQVLNYMNTSTITESGWVSFLAYPNLFGTKGLVAVLVEKLKCRGMMEVHKMEAFQTPPIFLIQKFGMK